MRSRVEAPVAKRGRASTTAPTPGATKDDLIVKVALSGSSATRGTEECIHSFHFTNDASARAYSRNAVVRDGDFCCLLRDETVLIRLVRAGDY